MRGGSNAHDAQYGETTLADNAWDSTIPTTEFRNELFDEIHTAGAGATSTDNGTGPNQKSVRIKTDERENLLENDELANEHNLQL